MIMALDAYISKTIEGFPVTFRFFRVRSMPGKCVAQAFVEVPEKKVYIKIDRSAATSLICGSPVKDLSAVDPTFVDFRNLVMGIVEEKITRWKDLKSKRYIAGENGEPGLGNYGVDEDLEYVDWALKRIKQTGDVEHGAEVVLRTEEGQKMLRDNPHSDALKEEVHETQEHIINTGIKADDYDV